MGGCRARNKETNKWSYEINTPPIKEISQLFLRKQSFNPLTPNDHYSGRTAPLTSKHFILYIY